MRQSSSGFTLIELLIVIAIIGILAAVLIPNLVVSRARAFDVGTQACLKELGLRQEAFKVDPPWIYDPNFDPSSISACDGVVFESEVVTDNDYSYVARHTRGLYSYTVSTGTPVTRAP